MSNLDDLPVKPFPVTPMVASTTTPPDYLSAFKIAVDAPIEKFMILFLMGLLIYIMKALVKFIDVKFIDKRMQTFSKVAENTNATQELTLEKNQKFLTDLTAWKSNLLGEMSKHRVEMLKDANHTDFQMRKEFQDEVISLKLALGKLSLQVKDVNDGLPSVQEAVSKYQNDVKEVKALAEKVDVINLNYSKIIGTLEKKKSGG